jgi:hypothetical protein
MHWHLRSMRVKHARHVACFSCSHHSGAVLMCLLLLAFMPGHSVRYVQQLLQPRSTAVVGCLSGQAFIS